MESLTDDTMSRDRLRDSYNDVPYPSNAIPYTHPSRMSAIASLRGMQPASPASCRVLELGCADGGNLLPMARQFPDSRFVGIDLSPVQISAGLERVKNLGVSNLQLLPGDILELPGDELTEFDYIIAHGVYSWVSRDVQQKILSICRDHLADHGLAYISYNTFPGWHGKQALQRMFRYHTRHIDDLQKKVAAVFEFISVLPSSGDAPGDPAAELVQRLRYDLDHMADPATYLIHEYLIDSNSPLYFTEFLEQAAAFELQYVDDAFPGSTAVERMPPNAQQWISGTIPDLIEQQQYVDFVCNIAFRRSLLCRQQLSIDDRTTFQRFHPLHVTATCRSEEADDGTARYRTDSGRVFSVGHPALAHLLETLVNVRPESISVMQLRIELGNDLADEDIAAMFRGLLHNAAIEFTSYPSDCSSRAGERPCASELVRVEASSGLVTSALHRPVTLTGVPERHLLPLLDGTRSVEELITLLQQKLTPDNPLSDEQWLTMVEDHLKTFAELGLLTSVANRSPS